MLKTKPQNKNGAIILGSLFPKKDRIDHSRPSERAPDSIKNNTTPVLKSRIMKSNINHTGEGRTPYSLTILSRVYMKTCRIITESIANALNASK